MVLPKISWFANSDSSKKEDELLFWDTFSPYTQCSCWTTMYPFLYAAIYPQCKLENMLLLLCRRGSNIQGRFKFNFLQFCLFWTFYWLQAFMIRTTQERHTPAPIIILCRLSQINTIGPFLPKKTISLRLNMGRKKMVIFVFVCFF